MNTASDIVVKHSLAILYVQKWFAVDITYYVKIWPKLTIPLQKRRFPISIPS